VQHKPLSYKKLGLVFRGRLDPEAVPPGYNPVAAIKTKPKAKTREARWFEVHEAALILEAARIHRPARPDLALPFIYPLIACYLLTGGRKSEVLGLEVEDISFDRKTVTFRSNEWRRLKTEKSHRVVPLWPQLKEILGRYLTIRPPSRLLFPAILRGREQLIWSVDKPLDEIAERIGLGPGMIRAQMFRNTCCVFR
jgi:integrase